LESIIYTPEKLNRGEVSADGPLRVAADLVVDCPVRAASDRLGVRAEIDARDTGLEAGRCPRQAEVAAARNQLRAGALRDG
jgi:hypothetical protein